MPSSVKSNSTVDFISEIFQNFRNMAFLNKPMHVTGSSAKLWNAEASPVTLLKSDSTTDALAAVLKIFETLTETICHFSV